MRAPEFLLLGLYVAVLLVPVNLVAAIGLSFVFVGLGLRASYVESMRCGGGGA